MYVNTHLVTFIDRC